MTGQEFQALRDAARGLILFHDGSWGAPTCYMWAGPDGREAGRVPAWESDALDRLTWRRLTSVQRGVGPMDDKIVATTAGMDLLSAEDHPARAA